MQVFWRQVTATARTRLSFFQLLCWKAATTTILSTTTLPQHHQKIHSFRGGDSTTKTMQDIQDIIGTDAGGRGMKSLIVPGDLEQAANTFVLASQQQQHSATILILSGFPCCVTQTPPTETDGPPGAVALARAGVAVGYQRVVVVTDDCNRSVFAAALRDENFLQKEHVELITFPPENTSALRELAETADLIVACERAGPASDGNCYTMRGTSMAGLVAPLHLLVEYAKPKTPFLAIGDGGNELGMGKVYDPHIINNIPNGKHIGCVVAADYLVAASVSNWGGYALAAAVALVQAKRQNEDTAKWIDLCLPTEQGEVALLNRCVEAGCRDGVSGKMEATVDGMPLERSLQCLRDIRQAALGCKKKE